VKVNKKISVYLRIAVACTENNGGYKLPVHGLPSLASNIF
jgi:hypothetical protein